MTFILKAISAILAFFIFSQGAPIDAYSPLDSDNLITSFTVIADGHMEGNNSQKHKNYGELFCDMASAEVKSSALVMLGDNTMNAQYVESCMLFGLMNKYNTIDNVLMAVGNHEICRDDTAYEKLRDRFILFNNTFLEHKTDTLYHSQVIDGYRFILLATESNSGIEQYLSDEQLEWLDNELYLASQDDKPVFIFNHWPLNDVFADVWQEGHVGEQSDELYSLLTKYDNQIFFFSGHLHMGIFENGYGIDDRGDITFINVPSFGSYNDEVEADNQDTGMGMQVEIYEKSIIIRVRSFVSHEWTDYEYQFDIA